MKDIRAKCAEELVGMGDIEGALRISHSAANAATQAMTDSRRTALTASTSGPSESSRSEAGAKRIAAQKAEQADTGRPNARIIENILQCL